MITINKFTPLIQTFSVPTTYRNGVFVDSIDLFFQSKDRTSIPVGVILGPTVNGIPNYNEYYKGSEVIKLPSSVRVSSNTNLATNFRFETPVHLSPGIHYLAIKTDSKEYNLYTAVEGAEEIGSTRIISRSPYSGNLYLPTDEESRVILNEDIKFIMYNCFFSNLTSEIVFTNSFEEIGSTLENTINPNDYSKYFDTFNFSSDDYNFNSTSINYSYKRTNESGVLDPSYSLFNLRKDIDVDRSKLSSNSFYVKATLSTNDRYLSPMIDKERVDSVFIKNVVNNDSSGENLLVGGNTQSKYVTKVVELLPNIDANDIAVFAYLKLPSTTDVKVFYKAAPAGVDIVTQTNYVEMTREALGVPNTNEFVEYKFTTPTSYALTDQSNYNKFQIKVLLLSSTPHIVPVVKEFRTIALND